MTNGLKDEYRTVDGLRIRYAESDSSASQYLVLTSPWPESLYAFDRMWPRLSGIAGLLPQIFAPVQIITGRNDPIVPVANAGFLHARLPNSRLDVLDAGHLAWEEAPGDYGAIIAAWVTGGYLSGGTPTGRP
jgi:fermentation-respiration switch protein FrsA (DUF1100 family)